MNRIRNTDEDNQVEREEKTIPVLFEMEDGRFVSTTIKTEDGDLVINPILSEMGISLEDLTDRKPPGGFYIID